MEIILTGTGHDGFIGQITDQQHLYWMSQHREDLVGHLFAERSENLVPPQYTIGPCDQTANIYHDLTCGDDSSEIIVVSGGAETFRQMVNDMSTIEVVERPVTYSKQGKYFYGSHCVRGVFDQIHIPDDHFDPSNLVVERTIINGDVVGYRLLSYRGFESTDQDLEYRSIGAEVVGD